MKTIGIKLADGSFYPLLEEGKPSKKSINLTTVQDNQTIVHVDVYRSETGTMEDAEYIDTLEIKDLKPHTNGEPSFNLDIVIDENNELSANIHDPETGNANTTQVELSSKMFSQSQNPPIHFEKDPTISEATTEDSSGVMLDDNTLSEGNFLSANQDDFEQNPQDSDEDKFTISQDEIENIGFGNQNKEQEANEMLGASPNDEDFSFDLLNDEQKNKSAEENLNEENIVDDNFDFADLENSVDLNDISFDDDSNVEDIDATVTDISDEKSDNSDEKTPEKNSDEFVASPVGIKVSKGHKHSSEKKVPSVDEVLAENAADLTSDSDATSTASFNKSDVSAESSEISDEPSEGFGEQTESSSDQSEGFDTISKTSAATTESSAEPSDDFSAISESSSDQTESFDTTSENSAEQESDIDLDLPDFNVSTENSDTKSDDSFASDTLSEETDTFANTSESSADTTDSFSEVRENFTNQTQDFSTDDVPEDFAATTDAFSEQTESFNKPSDASSNQTENPENQTQNTSDDFSDFPDFSNDFSTDGLDDETFGNENQNDDSSSENSKISAVGLSSAFDNDIGEPDLSTDELDDNFDANFDDSDLDSLKTKDPTFEPKNDMFSDLYDKETIEGNSSYSAEDDVKKKTKVPVIICITCAIICILAALFVLFIIPSKFNLLKKSQKANENTNTELENQQENLNQTEKTETELLSEVPTDENQENVEDFNLIEELEDVTETQENPSDLIEENQANFESENSNQQNQQVESEENSQNAAQEDEIVIAENPQNLVPKEPEPSTKTPEIIRYKIKWGDTLWDISNAYYKNPWRYKYLANYNGIKNPDYIISGTWLLIPSE